MKLLAKTCLKLTKDINICLILPRISQMFGFHKYESILDTGNSQEVLTLFQAIPNTYQVGITEYLEYHAQRLSIF